jgi:hypothetical protein
LIIPSEAVCEVRAARVGIYDSKSRDWTAGMALAEKLFPEYKS